MFPEDRQYYQKLLTLLYGFCLKANHSHTQTPPLHQYVVLVSSSKFTAILMIKRSWEGWEYRMIVECLPGIGKALALIPSTGRWGRKGWEINVLTTIKIHSHNSLCQGCSKFTCIQITLGSH
jgi:hypothetical protein